VTPRYCLNCGTPEVRTPTATNLDPIFWLCVDCLSRAAREAKAGEAANVALPFDAKAAAAGRDE